MEIRVIIDESGSAVEPCDADSIRAAIMALESAYIERSGDRMKAVRDILIITDAVTYGLEEEQE